MVARIDNPPGARTDGASTERVRFRSTERLDRNEERITLSMGVAEWRNGDGSSRRLIAEADRALLEAKAAGRNQVRGKSTGLAAGFLDQTINGTCHLERRSSFMVNVPLLVVCCC